MFFSGTLTTILHVAVTVIVVGVATGISLGYDCLGIVLELNVSAPNAPLCTKSHFNINGILKNYNIRLNVTSYRVSSVREGRELFTTSEDKTKEQCPEAK